MPKILFSFYNFFFFLIQTILITFSLFFSFLFRKAYSFFFFSLYFLPCRHSCVDKFVYILEYKIFVSSLNLLIFGKRKINLYCFIPSKSIKVYFLCSILESCIISHLFLISQVKKRTIEKIMISLSLAQTTSHWDIKSTITR